MTDRLSRAIEALAFDDALAELQRTVAELEAGGQPLEAAIACTSAASRSSEHCERLLDDAELRVQQLVQRAGGGSRRATSSPTRPPRSPGA